MMGAESKKYKEHMSEKLKGWVVDKIQDQGLHSGFLIF